MTTDLRLRLAVNLSNLACGRPNFVATPATSPTAYDHLRIASSCHTQVVADASGEPGRQVAENRYESGKTWRRVDPAERVDGGIYRPGGDAETYSAMTTLDQYLIEDREAEIAMAKSAAPPSISDHADVLVLTRHGYETAVKGSNGFVCAVERGWMAPFDRPEFWNPRIRGPLCFNSPAARSILPYTFKRTELVLAGRTVPQMIVAMKTMIEDKRVPRLETGSMSYMTSKISYLNDAAGHYFPRTSASTWGADLAGAPMVLNGQFQDSPEAMSVLMITVPRWSDGTPVQMVMH